jgi:hypothetical protein
MKTKTKPRARRLWANFYSNGAVAFFSTKRSACLFKGFSKAATVPVAVIPLHEPTALGDSMVSALAAIGVLPKPRKGGRK